MLRGGARYGFELVRELSAGRMTTMQTDRLVDDYVVSRRQQRTCSGHDAQS
jgi:hypothetical protein